MKRQPLSRCAPVFLALVAACLLSAALALPTLARAESCANEQVRERQGDVGLPDCRAWEMVSPLEKNGGDIAGIDVFSGGGVAQAAADGNGVTYVSAASFADPRGAPLASQYLSAREAGGWGTENITTPLLASTYFGGGQGAPYKSFSSDLSSGVLTNDEQTGAVENPPIPGAPAGYKNLYLRDSATGGLRPLLTSVPEEAAETFRFGFQGATPDLEQVVVGSHAALTPGATNGGARNNLYEWGAGGLYVVSEPPNPVTPGETLAGARLGSGVEGDPNFNPGHTISSDGSRVFWTSGSTGGTLFVREGIGSAQARTVQIDKPEAGVAEPPHVSIFRTATPDGSRAFFTSTEPLTSSGREGSDLYDYDVDTGVLSDLTPDVRTEDPLGADVLGVMGTSEDGSYVYFVANGVLGDGAARGATLGNCSEGESEPGAGCNMYVWHDGVTSFLARLSGDDESGNGGLGVAHDWAASLSRQTTRVSADGRRLVFMSDLSLTGYANSGPSCVPVFSGEGAVTGYGPGRCQEVYAYGVGSGVQCVSCNASGVVPAGPSSIPGGTNFKGLTAAYQSRVLSADGSRVFFDSDDALVSADTNNHQDVYEWEQPGAGSCSSSGAAYSVSDGGCVSLISSGQDSEGSTFIDAGEDGDDVFFITRAQLTRGDSDDLIDLYDARAPHVPGETVAFEQGSVSPLCEGERCKPPASAAPVFATPASSTFVGAGNTTPAGTPVAVKARAKPLTRAQELAVALKLCGKDRSKRRRAKCRAQARKKYAPAKKVSK